MNDLGVSFSRTSYILLK